MAKIYVAFYDDEDGVDRESWNTFYTPWVAATTEADARRLAEEAIKARTVELLKDWHNIDLTQVADESALPERVQEDLKYLRDLENRMGIEIQSGELT